MYLVDTNVFLEALLEQEKTPLVRSFFQSVDLSEIYITDFSLHSIGIILFQLKKTELFISFIDDMITDGIDILSLSPKEREKNLMEKISLEVARYIFPPYTCTQYFYK